MRERRRKGDETELDDEDHVVYCTVGGRLLPSRSPVVPAAPLFRRDSEFGAAEYGACAAKRTAAVKRERKRNLLFPPNPEAREGCKPPLGAQPGCERAPLQDPVLDGVLEDGGVTLGWERCGLQRIQAGKLPVVLCSGPGLSQLQQGPFPLWRSSIQKTTKIP